MASDAPSWLTEENVKSAIKVSENPTAKKVLNYLLILNGDNN